MVNQNSTNTDVVSGTVLIETVSPARIGIGNNTLGSATGTNNIAIGNSAGSATTTASNNTCIGSEALTACTTGGSNTAVGRRALRTISSGTFSVAVGTDALRFATGSLNVAVGALCGDAVTLGGQNICVGYASLGQLTTGNNNTCVGYFSGFNYTSNETNNICLGHNVGGTLAESNVVRIGSSISKTFIDGIRGTTTDNADAIPVYIDSSGQLGTVAGATSSPSYGQLYEDTPAGTNLSLTVSPTYAGWVSATAGDVAGAGLVTADTASATADNLTVGTNGGGLYLISVQASFSGTNNAVVFYSVFKNGTRLTNVSGKRKLGIAGDVGSASCVGIESLASTDTIDLRFATDADTPSIDIVNCSLSMTRIG